MRALIQILERKSEETPEQKAIWAAWDQFSGTEKVGEFESFEGAFHSLVLSLEVDAEGADSRKAEKLGGFLRGTEKRSRKWRSAYNMWVKGRDIDTDRLKTDLKKTKSDVEAARKKLVGLSKAAGAAGYKSDHTAAIGIADKTAELFGTAIGKL